MKRLPWLTAAAAFTLPAAAAAETPASPATDSGDTAWVLVSTALVLMMTAPGLAMFYGGLVRAKNILSTMMHSIFTLCFISLAWVLWGYSLAFGTDAGGMIGGFDFLGFGGVGAEPVAGQTIPHTIFAMYQGVFAVITVALISGAYAERMKFAAYALFSILWFTVIYTPLAHWVWGGGWLMKFGALDFAGGTVVHISSGVSALVAAVMLGRRSGYPKHLFAPHDLTMTVIGASLLWVGWFGFNAGSALGANGLAALAFVTTNTAAAAAGVAWAIVESLHRGKPTALGVASGIVAGLVAITPGAGFVTVPAAILIGLAGGALCYAGVNVVKQRFGYDDALDVFGVHGLGGTWGALATGLFATKAVNPAGDDGLFYGNPGQMVEQLVGVGATVVLAGAGSMAILALVKAVVGLRVAPEDEYTGLDLAAHGESAYNLGPASGGTPAPTMAAPVGSPMAMHAHGAE